MATKKKGGVSVYQIVTDRILNELLQGTIPWEKPWVAGETSPLNYVTRDHYRGVNRLLLPKPGEYLTANQVAALHGTIPEDKREAAHIVTFFTMVPNRGSAQDPDDDEEAEGRHPIFRYYRVWHVSDIEGVTPKCQTAPAEGRLLRPDAEAERIVRSYASREGVRVVRSGDSARYDAATDTVYVPALENFRSREAHYQVLFHELVHSTGCDARLGRGVREAAYDEDDYSREQLTAEIGANMLLCLCGLDSDAAYRNSTARIAGWIQALREDPRMIVTAARGAEKAVSLILGEAAA